ncbi:MAG: hypothetical protein JSC189_001139 [Candidatus Tokpelaia sp. JSC189]|nr:MAG: hypothetical protein JSC189_001139 [Candidatus Tokpelaia sp. JSC189]
MMAVIRFLLYRKQDPSSVKFYDNDLRVDWKISFWSTSVGALWIYSLFFVLIILIRSSKIMFLQVCIMLQLAFCEDIVYKLEVCLNLYYIIRIGCARE